MEIKGTVLLIKDEQVISDKFKKREIVLTTDEDSDYPQSVLFQTTQDKCDMLDNYKVGDKVEVSVNIRGKKWEPKDGGETKYFVTLEV